MGTKVNSFGNLGIVSLSLIRGWAVVDIPEVIPEVIIYADEHELCRAKANLFRKDLLDRGIHPTGYGGFEIRDFDKKKLKESNQIRAIISQTNKELFHSPLSLKKKISEHKNLAYHLLAFIHIPKTGGTSFRMAAQAYFGESSTLKDYGKNFPDTSKIVLDTVYNSKRNLFVNELVSHNIRFFTGHFYASQYYDILDADVKWCAFFRNPVERIISEYKHVVRHYGYARSLEYFCNLEWNCNKQYKFIEGLDLDQFYFIGITEHYNESIDLFNAIGGYGIEKLRLNMDRKENDGNINLEHKQLKMIERNNILDLELYHKAYNLFHGRLSDYNIKSVEKPY